MLRACRNKDNLWHAFLLAGEFLRVGNVKSLDTTAFGEFEGLATIYGIICAAAFFLRRKEMRKAIRCEDETNYVARIVREKTETLLEFYVLCFAIGGGIFILFGLTWAYDGPWWIPYLTNVPAAIAILVTMSYLQVIRFVGDDESKDLVAAKYEGHENLFMLAFFISFIWPIVGSILLISSYQVVDWVSVFVIVGVPFSLSLSVFIGGWRAAKW
jgi:hypothetical protein